MRRDPILITSALLSALGPLVGNGIYAGPSGSTDEVLASARAGLPVRGYIGMSLELVGFAAMAVLIGWLVAQLGRRSPVAAATTGVAGAALLAVKVGSAGPVMAAYYLADKLDARTVDLLFNLNGEAFVIDGFFTSIAFAAAGVGLLRVDVPRWLAWWPIVAGALGTVAAIVGVTNPDAYVPIPFLLLLVWLIALAIRSATGGSDSSEQGTTQPQLAATMGA